jgi:SAM-dependent methyltransferase
MWMMKVQKDNSIEYIKKENLDLPSFVERIYESKQRNLFSGLYPTEIQVARLMASFSKQFSYRNVLDPACGVGSILYCISEIDESIQLTGFDINQECLEIANHYLPNAMLINGDFLKQSFSKKFDLITCHIPYGLGSYSKNITLELSFMKKCLENLDAEGTLICIVPNSVLIASSYEDIRRSIIDEFSLEAVIDLSIKTNLYNYLQSSLLVIRKTSTNGMTYFDQIEDNIEINVQNFKTKTGGTWIKKESLSTRLDREYYDQQYIELTEELLTFDIKNLEDLAKIYRGTNYNPEVTKDNGQYLVLSGRNIKDGVVLHTAKDKFVDGIDINNKNNILQPGDIVISLIFNDRKLYLYKQSDPIAVISSNCVIIRSFENEYIKTYLNTEEGKRVLTLQMERIKKGETIPHINLSDLKKIKIPILPFENLNLLSDEAIENAREDELYHLRESVAVWKAKYEAVLSSNSQVLELLVNRFNKLDNKIDSLISKVDEILEMVKGLQNEISVIKSLPTSEDQIIIFINDKIDVLMSKINNKELEHYTDITKAWLEPEWHKLEFLSSSLFLPSAELLFENTSKIENIDPAPFLLQYCRALENELYKKIFEIYLLQLKEKNVINGSQFSWDLEVNENGNPRAKNKSSYSFAQKIHEMLQKEQKQWFFELGGMSRNLESLTGNTVEKSPLLSHFREFILKYFNSNFVDKEIFEKIKFVASEYRNKSAHPNLIDVPTAKVGREIIMGLIKSLLMNYKDKP